MNLLKYLFAVSYFVGSVSGHDHHRDGHQNQSIVEEAFRRISKLPAIPYDHVQHLYNLAMSGFQPKVVYDLGASLMHWTVASKKIWPESFYVMFDALDSAEFLYKESGHPYFVGIVCADDKKSIKFHYGRLEEAAIAGDGALCHAIGGQSYYREVGNTQSMAAFPADGGVDRVCRTLSSIAEERGFPLPDMIKMDIQGAELDVIRGSKDLFLGVEYIVAEIQSMEYNLDAPKADTIVPVVESMGFLLTAPMFAKNLADADYGFRRLHGYDYSVVPAMRFSNPVPHLRHSREEVPSSRSMAMDNQFDEKVLSCSSSRVSLLRIQLEGTFGVLRIPSSEVDVDVDVDDDDDTDTAATNGYSSFQHDGTFYVECTDRDTVLLAGQHLRYNFQYRLFTLLRKLSKDGLSSDSDGGAKRLYLGRRFPVSEGESEFFLSSLAASTTVIALFAAEPVAIGDAVPFNQRIGLSIGTIGRSSDFDRRLITENDELLPGAGRFTGRLSQAKSFDHLVMLKQRSTCPTSLHRYNTAKKLAEDKEQEKEETRKKKNKSGTMKINQSRRRRPLNILFLLSDLASTITDINSAFVERSSHLDEVVRRSSNNKAGQQSHHDNTTGTGTATGTGTQESTRVFVSDSNLMIVELACRLSLKGHNVAVIHPKSMASALQEITSRSISISGSSRSSISKNNKGKVTSPTSEDSPDKRRRHCNCNSSLRLLTDDNNETSRGNSSSKSEGGVSGTSAKRSWSWESIDISTLDWYGTSLEQFVSSEIAYAVGRSTAAAAAAEKIVHVHQNDTRRQQQEQGGNSGSSSKSTSTEGEENEKEKENKNEESKKKSTSGNTDDGDGNWEDRVREPHLQLLRGIVVHTNALENNIQEIIRRTEQTASTTTLEAATTTAATSSASTTAGDVQPKDLWQEEVLNKRLRFPKLLVVMPDHWSDDTEQYLYDSHTQLFRNIPAYALTYSPWSYARTKNLNLFDSVLMVDPGTDIAAEDHNNLLFPSLSSSPTTADKKKDTILSYDDGDGDGDEDIINDKGNDDNQDDDDDDINSDTTTAGAADDGDISDDAPSTICATYCKDDCTMKWLFVGDYLHGGAVAKRALETYYEVVKARVQRRAERLLVAAAAAAASASGGGPPLSTNKEEESVCALAATCLDMQRFYCGFIQFPYLPRCR